MNNVKYIGRDVHKASVSVAVLEGAALLEFFRGLRGTLQVSLEEGTYAEWLYGLLGRPVAKIVVCDPRQNPQRKLRNKSVQLDARKLAEWLRWGVLKPVYHGNVSLQTLRELACRYLTLVRDGTRVRRRLKAL